MLNSMTGQGRAQTSTHLGTITIEIRTVNNRGLKLHTRLNEPLNRFEAKLSHAVREHLVRGTVNINASWRHAQINSSSMIDTSLLRSHAESLRELQREIGGNTTIDLACLTQLPGVVIESDIDQIDMDQLWEQFLQCLNQAMADLANSRRSEGAAMLVALQADHLEITQCLEAVARLAPGIVDAYRQRMENRISDLLEQRGLDISKVDIIKEVQFFADRTDISEEITRLRSHLEMFNETIAAEQAAGRRLDFVVQEMFRETNTIGAKASDSEIAQKVVDMKCAIERMREMIQNVE